MNGRKRIFRWKAVCHLPVIKAALLRCQLTGTALSSPLSDLPDLPTELPESPQPVSSPPRTMQKRLMSPQAEAHAESSTTAAKRARLASAERDLPLAKVNGVKKGEGKDEGLVVSGKRARKQIQTLDFNEFDDLESISDGDQENRRDRVNAKAGKGANGKSKRLSRCLPQCPELIHSGTTEKKGRWRLLRQDCRRTEGSTSLVRSLTH